MGWDVRIDDQSIPNALVVFTARDKVRRCVILAMKLPWSVSAYICTYICYTVNEYIDFSRFFMNFQKPMTVGKSVLQKWRSSINIHFPDIFKQEGRRI